MNMATLELPRPLTSSTIKLHSSTDVITRKSDRLVQQKKNKKQLIKTMSDLLIPNDSDNSLINTNPQQIALVKDLVTSRKRKWSLREESRTLYQQQLDTYQYLTDRSEELKKRYAEVQDICQQVQEAREKSVLLRTLNVDDMTPEEKREDAKHTMLEYEYSELYNRYQEDAANQQKLSQEFEDNFGKLEAKKNDYLAIHEDIQNKRRRLVKEMPPFRPEEVENYILSVIVEQKEKYQAELDQLKRKYEPFHCPLCSDTIATCVFPCCSHGTCHSCAQRMVENGRLNCPFCRRLQDASALVEMKF